ncbi:hypothetical protein V1477_006865 [Vespula maculifrons]|uniref:Uncharacterized protein n=1 Tax=Vespula maculifrons TaxID=7453 RepID=A0ABD2CGX1_VESMC
MQTNKKVASGHKLGARASDGHRHGFVITLFEAFFYDKKNLLEKLWKIKYRKIRSNLHFRILSHRRFCTVQWCVSVNRPLTRPDLLNDSSMLLAWISTLRRGCSCSASRVICKAYSAVELRKLETEDAFAANTILVDGTANDVSRWTWSITFIVDATLRNTFVTISYP